MNKKTKTIIITGLQRSGTLLMTKLCNSHPDITITSEFGIFLGNRKSFFSYLIQFLKMWHRNYRKKAPFVKKDIMSQKRIILNNNIFMIKYLLKIIKYIFKKIDSNIVANVYSSIFNNSKVVGDKYPDYIFELDEFARNDNISIIVIYRDCRDVTSSTLIQVKNYWHKFFHNRKFIRLIDTPEKIAHRWVKTIRLMEKHKNKVFVVRYEELIEKREIVIKSLAQWLGVQVDGFNHDIVKSTSIGKFRQNLSADDLAAIMKIAGPTMKEMGYI